MLPEKKQLVVFAILAFSITGAQSLCDCDYEVGDYEPWCGSSGLLYASKCDATECGTHVAEFPCSSIIDSDPDDDISQLAMCEELCSESFLPPSCEKSCGNPAVSTFDPHCGANGVLYANECQGTKCSSHTMFFACSLFLLDDIENLTEEEVKDAYNECGTVCAESKIQDTTAQSFVPPAVEFDNFDVVGVPDSVACGPEDMYGDLTLDGTIDIQDVVAMISVSLKLPSADEIPDCAIELTDYNHDGVNGTVADIVALIMALIANEV